MNILFIYPALHLGGIETLIVRTIEHLTQQGHTVTLALKESPDPRTHVSNQLLLEQVQRDAKVIYLGKRTNLFTIFFKRVKGDFDRIYCFNTYSFLFGLIIRRTLPISIPIATGAYHPREYSVDLPTKRYHHRIMDSILNAIPTSNMFFMDEVCRDELARYTQRDFNDSPIIPLPIQFNKFKHTVRRTDRKKIVSIGRITNFKTYNFKMIDVVEELCKKGHDISYHIYGYGNQEKDLLRYIKSKPMARVTFHGPLPYDQFATVLEDAFLFVGMGTAIIEAAACGVPALIAIESNPLATTYGFFHECQGWSALGEIIPGQQEFPFTHKIEQLLETNSQEYAEFEQKSRARAEDFAIDTIMGRFVEALQAVQPYEYRITPLMGLIDTIEDFLWKFWRRLGFTDPLQIQFMRQPHSSQSATKRKI
jgi:glycosyltransferase involved in cell wall biosynthesis